MKIRTIYYILPLILLLPINTYSQQQPLYSQFTFNRYLFNPAVAGCEQITTIKATGYEQWVGFKGAPKFHTLSFDSRVFTDTQKPRRNVRKKFKLSKPGTIGAGGYFFNEKYGLLSHTGVAATYSYHIKLGSQQLSFGLSPVLSNLGVKSSDVVLPDDEFDQLLEGDKTNRWIIDFNFGIFLMSKDYFAGYSIHHLTSAALQWGGSLDEDYQLRRQHYLMGGYKYEATSDLYIEPSMMLRIPEGSKVQLDITFQTTIKRDYWCGLTYKTSKTLSVFGGLQLDRYLFSYAFDYNLSQIRKYSYGSHEIMLAVQLGENTHRYKWLNTY
jgi:type IX secretion system PorP/SprF family membrane protein